MFSALRQGSPLWVLDKSNLTLQMGSVVSFTQPAGYNMPWINLPGQTMDITVKMEDGTNSEFKQLQSSLSIAQYGNVLVCESSEAMAKEIENLDAQSKSVIESVPYHRKAREAYEMMKKKLSPAYAKERMTDDRLTRLEQSNEQLAKSNEQMANGINAIQEMLVKMQGTSKKQ